MWKQNHFLYLRLLFWMIIYHGPLLYFIRALLFGVPISTVLDFFFNTIYNTVYNYMYVCIILSMSIQFKNNFKLVSNNSTLAILICSLIKHDGEEKLHNLLFTIFPAWWIWITVHYSSYIREKNCKIAEIANLICFSPWIDLLYHYSLFEKKTPEKKVHSFIQTQTPTVHPALPPRLQSHCFSSLFNCFSHYPPPRPPSFSSLCLRCAVCCILFYWYYLFLQHYAIMKLFNIHILYVQFLRCLFCILLHNVKICILHCHYDCLLLFMLKMQK